MTMDRRAREVFTDPAQTAAALLTLGADRFGAGCVNWLPETWRMEVESLCGAGPDETALHRLLAAAHLYAWPDAFYESAAGFCPLAQALAGPHFDAGVFDPPDTETCARAVLEARLLYPPGREFSPEVGAYVHRRAAHDGYAGFPPVFRAFGLAPDPALPENPLAAADPEGPDDGLSETLARSAHERAEELGEVVRDHLRLVARQLAALPLVSGDARAAAAELLAHAGPAGDDIV